jgi:phosphomannomutase/phosphoglucomutase
MVDFFRSYDLRGRYPEQISRDEARTLGKAYGTFIESEKVVIGRDGRKHGQKVRDAFVEGLKSTGADIRDAGMVPTPLIYFAVNRLEFENGAVISASHNPPEYTGFKFAVEDGMAMSRENGMKQIQEIYEEENFETGKGSIQQIEVKEKYVEEVSKAFESDLSVAVNYGNGVSAEVAPEVLEGIGCDVKHVNQEIDGDFPNHLPDPQNEEAQKALMKEMDGEDLGIIFDGDGDRAGFMIDGEYISEDKILALFSEEILSESTGKVIHDLRASKLVKEVIEENGGEAVESRVGHTYISEMIHGDSEVVFAGELSAHYYFPSLGFPWDDGIVAAAFMAQIIDQRGTEALEKYPDYPVSPELRIECPEERKQEIVEEIKERFSDREMSMKDGVKIYFDEGWSLIRPSSTEPKISLRSEADTEEGLSKIMEKVEPAVRNLCDHSSES